MHMLFRSFETPILLIRPDLPSNHSACLNCSHGERQETWNGLYNGTTEPLPISETSIFRTHTLRISGLLIPFRRPDLTIKKRRGGRRIRKMKERFEETALMKQANTRAFSAQAGEYGDDAMGLTMGLLDTADVAAGGAGAPRKRTEKRKMKYANTKASRRKAAQMSAQANAASAQSGLASSMVFTPAQGMELVNPDANKERVNEANRKWFSENAGFKSALPKK